MLKNTNSEVSKMSDSNRSVRLLIEIIDDIQKMIGCMIDDAKDDIEKKTKYENAVLKLTRAKQRWLKNINFK